MIFAVGIRWDNSSDYAENAKYLKDKMSSYKAISIGSSIRLIRNLK